MNGRKMWIVSAVLMIVFFIGARIYVGRAMDDAAERPAARLDAPVAVPSPQAVTPASGNRQIERLVLKVQGAIPGHSPEQPQHVMVAHATLNTFTRYASWTPEQWASVAARLEQASEPLSDTTNPELQALETHMLAVRIEALERAGTPDERLRQALTSLKTSHPERFVWHQVAEPSDPLLEGEGEGG